MKNSKPFSKRFWLYSAFWFIREVTYIILFQLHPLL